MEALWYLFMLVVAVGATAIAFAIEPIAGVIFLVLYNGPAIGVAVLGLVRLAEEAQANRPPPPTVVPPPSVAERRAQAAAELRRHPDPAVRQVMHEADEQLQQAQAYVQQFKRRENKDA